MHIPWIAIYPRHDVTDKLMRLVASELGDDTPPLFPLQLIRTSSVSPIIFSPVEREQIGIYVGRRFKNGGMVVLIDDGIVTGKTIREMTQLVEGLWELHIVAGNIKRDAPLLIRTAALLDRTGMPTQRSLVQKFVRDHARLWRWDVPSLGHEASCVLCASLERCRDLRARIQNPALLARLNQWLELWEPVPVETTRLDRGLTPKPIDPPDATRFCIEETESGVIVAHEVTHHISTSRAALGAEICRSTTRKDYVLAKVSAGQFRGGRPMDLQTKVEMLSSNLLLFMNELTMLDRLERLDGLIQLLWQSSEQSSTTSLASVSLLADSQLCGALWRGCYELIEQHGFPNDDALITAIALYQFGGRTGLASGRHGAWAIFRILAASTNAVRGSLCRIFQVVGSDADSFHQGILLDLLNKDPPNAGELSQIVLILEELARSLHQLPPELTFGTNLESRADAATVNELAKQIRILARQTVEAQQELGPQASVRSLARICVENDQVRLQLRDILLNAFTRLFAGPASLQSAYRSALCVELRSKPPVDYWLDKSMHDLSVNWKTYLQKKDHGTFRGVERR